MIFINICNNDNNVSLRYYTIVSIILGGLWFKVSMMFKCITLISAIDYLRKCYLYKI